MNRRRLLLAGGGALAALPLAPATRAGAPPQGLRVLDSYVVSRDRFPAAADPRPGERLRLVRDPGRPFDPGSVRVERAPGEPLGYLPGQPAQVLAALMDHGVGAEAMVREDGAIRVFLHLETPAA